MKILKIIKTAKVCAETAPKLRNDKRLMTGGGPPVEGPENKKAQLKFS